MNDTDHLQLRFGTYHTPRFKYGQVVACEARGDVVIVGLSGSSVAVGSQVWCKGPSLRHDCPLGNVVRKLAKFCRKMNRV